MKVTVADVPNGVDELSEMILSMVGAGASVREMCQVIDRGVASVHARLLKLEEYGLVEPPPKKGMHRSRKLTPLGESYLKANYGEGGVRAGAVAGIRDHELKAQVRAGHHVSPSF